MPKEELIVKDQAFDQALRPQSWGDYIGQERVKENLQVMIEAAKKRQEPADHILLTGQAGLGKTTLAYLVAKELGGQLKVTSGPALEKVGDLAALLTNLEADDVLFIDEAHRMNRLIEEVLYPAMENRKLHVMLGKGPAARSITLELPPFTLIAATTRENLLSNPLRSRFGATFRLDFYDLGNLVSILERSAKLLKIESDRTALEMLARAARGTPRIANRLLRRARDFKEVQEAPLISEVEARATLKLLDVDELGLEPQDRKLLEVMIQKFGGGPVGLNTLAAALSEDRGALEDIYEPYLMKIGFLQRTPAGRTVLSPAYDHLNLKRKGGLL